MQACMYVCKAVFNLFRYSTPFVLFTSLPHSLQFGVVVSFFFLFYTLLSMLAAYSFVHSVVSFRFVSFVLFGVFCLFNIRKLCSMRECVSFFSLSLSLGVLFRGYTMNSNSTLNKQTQFNRSGVEE